MHRRRDTLSGLASATVVLVALASLLAACTGSTDAAPDPAPLQADASFLAELEGEVVAEEGSVLDVYDPARVPPTTRAASAYRLEVIDLDRPLIVDARLGLPHTSTIEDGETRTIDRLWRLEVESLYRGRVGGLYELVWIDDTPFQPSHIDAAVYLFDDELLVDGAELSASWGESLRTDPVTLSR